MELLLMLWILIWGLVPPVATGVWAYYQGKKGVKIALERYDLAMEHLDKIGNLRTILREPDPLTGKSMIREIQDSITGSVDGKLGTWLQKLREEMEEGDGGMKGQNMAWGFLSNLISKKK